MTIKDKKIIEDSEREGIPMFVFTAKDLLATDALERYRIMCQRERCSSEHVAGIEARIKEFKNWHMMNEDKMKYPD
jgi:hypothetical protein